MFDNWSVTEPDVRTFTLTLRNNMSHNITVTFEQLKERFGDDVYQVLNNRHKYWFAFEDKV
ncbi:MAG: hypothetical protein ACRC3J_09330 [Culicoidibacterales bacterium]